MKFAPELDEIESEEVAKIADGLGEMLENLNERYGGRLVQIVMGRYRNRKARITHVSIDRGQPAFLCMILRSDDEKEYLNTDGESRCYRPRNNFITLREEREK